VKLFPLIGKETDFRLEILLLGARLALKETMEIEVPVTEAIERERERDLRLLKEKEKEREK
jgi:hypothetical protein